MVTKELIDYIKIQLQKRKNPEEITAALLGSGWKEEDVIAALNQISNENLIPQSPIPQRLIEGLNEPIIQVSDQTSTNEKNSNIYPTIKIELIQNPSRFYAFPVLGGFVKGFMTLPQGIEFLVLVPVWGIVLTINSFCVLFTGRYWESAYNFNIGIIRFYTKIIFFVFGLTDKYPGFSLEIKDTYSVEMECPQNPNRFFAIPFIGGIVRYILLTPLFLYGYIIYQAAYLGMFVIAWIMVLFTGKYPETVFELTRDNTRLYLATLAYSTGLSDKYPSFHISMNHKAKKLILIGFSTLYFLFSFMGSFISSQNSGNNSEKVNDNSNQFSENSYKVGNIYPTLVQSKITATLAPTKIETTLVPTSTPTSVPSKLQGNDQKTIEDGVVAKINEALDDGNNIKIKVTFTNNSKSQKDVIPLHLHLVSKTTSTGPEPAILSVTLQPGETRQFDLSYQKLPDPPFQWTYLSSSGESILLGTYTP